MKCSLLTLSCALDGELSRERQAELESHLVTCERCRTGMRYLHEETERISSLARVSVAPSTATALLERARVATIPQALEAAADAGGPGTGSGQGHKDADPFSLMGMGAQIITVDEAPRAIIPLPPAEEASQAGPPEGEPPPPQVDASEATPAPITEPDDAVSTASDEAMAQGQVTGAPAGQGAVPEGGDLTGRDTTVDRIPLPAPGPVAGTPGEVPDTESATGIQDGSSGAGLPDRSREEAPGDLELTPALELDTGAGAEVVDDLYQADWVSSGDQEDQAEAGDDWSEAPPEPFSPTPASAESHYDWSEDDWLAESPATSGIGTGGEGEPPPLFVPFYLPVSEPEVVGPAVEAQSPGAEIWYPPEPEAAAPEVKSQEPVADRAEGPITSPAPVPSTRDSDEVMQVALEESALLGELNDLEHGPGEGLPQMSSPQETVSLPPPPSIVANQSARGTGWEPKATLDLGLLTDITAFKPDPPGPTATPSPVTPPQSSRNYPPPLETRGPKRPVDSVAPVRGSALGEEALPRRRPPRTAPSKAAPGKSSQGSAPPRSWTKTATIAIAALAVFLIGWSLLHHSTKPTSPAPSHHHAIVPTKTNPTPAQQQSPTPATTPAVTLTGAQTFGGTGSGYQVQGAQYGLHQNNTQLWVVFQLVTGSGAPKVTTGFDGTSSLYVEMAGVTPGTAVAQPFSGVVVTSVSPTQMSGFSGAVYLLKLSHSTQIVSEYLLPGSPTSSAGERVVLELQN